MATAIFFVIVLGATVLVRVRSLRPPQRDVDVSAFAPGDVLSLN
jgi:hypothetical protein